MESHDVYIDDYDWYLRIYYDFNKEYIDELELFMKLNNFSYESIDKTCNFLNTDYLNKGVTVVNKHSRKAVIVITETTSCGEFFNTMIHELNHLSDFIAEYYDIAPSGEDVSYMIGNIGMLLFPKAGKFLCKC